MEVLSTPAVSGDVLPVNGDHTGLDSSAWKWGIPDRDWEGPWTSESNRIRIRTSNSGAGIREEVQQLSTTNVSSVAEVHQEWVQTSSGRLDRLLTVVRQTQSSKKTSHEPWKIYSVSLE